MFKYFLKSNSIENEFLRNPHNLIFISGNLAKLADNLKYFSFENIK